MPICEANHVDIMLTGHDHNLQHIVRHDVVDLDYVVTGAGGRSSYAYDPVRYNAFSLLLSSYA